ALLAATVPCRLQQPNSGKPVCQPSPVHARTEERDRFACERLPAGGVRCDSGRSGRIATSKVPYQLETSQALDPADLLRRVRAHVECFGLGEAAGRNVSSVSPSIKIQRQLQRGCGAGNARAGIRFVLCPQDPEDGTAATFGK